MQTDHDRVEHLLGTGKTVIGGVVTKDGLRFIGFVKASTPETLTIRDLDSEQSDEVPWRHVQVAAFHIHKETTHA